MQLSIDAEWAQVDQSWELQNTLGTALTRVRQIERDWHVQSWLTGIPFPQHLQGLPTLLHAKIAAELWMVGWEWPWAKTTTGNWELSLTAITANIEKRERIYTWSLNIDDVVELNDNFLSTKTLLPVELKAAQQSMEQRIIEILSWFAKSSTGIVWEAVDWPGTVTAKVEVEHKRPAGLIKSYNTIEWDKIPANKMLTTTEIAPLLKRDPTTVRRMMREQVIPSSWEVPSKGAGTGSQGHHGRWVTTKEHVADYIQSKGNRNV